MSLEEKIANYTSQHDLSDFHIRSNQPMAIRVDGSVKLFEDDIITRQEIELFWKNSLNKVQLKEIVITKDLDFAVVVGEFRFRVNGYYSSYGPCMVLRKIVSEIPNIEKFLNGKTKAWFPPIPYVMSQAGPASPDHGLT